MNTRAWIRLAGVIIGIASATVLAIAVPHALWSISSLTAASFVVTSICMPLLLRMPLPHKLGNSDSATIWLIGPASFWFAILLAISIVALRLGLVGSSTACMVLDLTWLGALGAGWALLRASAEVVASAAAETGLGSEDTRNGWIALIKSHAAQSESESCRRILDGMVERLRYAANDKPPAAQHNVAIAKALAQIEETADQPDELGRLARLFEGLLEQREISIRAARSRA